MVWTNVICGFDFVQENGRNSAVKLEKTCFFRKWGASPRFGFAMLFAVAGLAAGAATKTWHPTVSSGGSYKWSEAANWLEGGAATSAPANGDSLAFDSSSAAITAVNDLANLQVAGIAFSGATAGARRVRWRRCRRARNISTLR